MRNLKTKIERLDMKTGIKILLTLLILVIIGIRQDKLVGWKPSALKNTTSSSSKVKEISLNDAKLLFPNASSLTTIDTAWVEVRDSKDKKIGELISTSPYSDKIIGFAGTTPLLIAIDTDDKIQKIELLANSESPDYVEHVRNNNLFKAWNGLTIEEAFAKKVDAVSGATYTSTGVIESLKARLNVIVKAKESSKISWDKMYKQVIQILLLSLALYCFFRPKKSKRVRNALLVLSIYVLGFWQSGMLSLAQFVSWLTNGIPLSMQIGLVAIFLCSIILPLFTGKAFYCVYLCPFGAAQEIVGKINKRKYTVQRNIAKYLYIIRKSILIAVVIVLIIGINIDLSLIEPFSAFNGCAASLSALIIAFISIVLSIFIHKPWCHYFCPAGEVLDLMKRKKR